MTTSRLGRATQDAAAALDALLDDLDTGLARAWAAAWQDVAGDWEEAAAAVAQLTSGGRWPTRTQILRLERATVALQHTSRAAQSACATSGSEAAARLTRLADLAGQAQHALIAAQLPDGDGHAATVVAQLRGVNRGALDRIVHRTTQQITALTRPLSAEMTARMRSSLVRGVAAGENPRATAAALMRRLGGDFAGGLTRAVTIARTEMLDAYRAAARAARVANRDVLAGWVWESARDDLTCAACLAMDGSMHPVEEDGPDGHPRCKCVAVPVTKTWQELGFDVEDPEPDRMSGRDWYDTLPEQTQQKIMGPARWQALRDGRLTWDDIPMVRHTPGWRDSVVTRPLNRRR